MTTHHKSSRFVGSSFNKSTGKWHVQLYLRGSLASSPSKQMQRFVGIITSLTTALSDL
jgi:hypothetical protein